MSVLAELLSRANRHLREYRRQTTRRREAHAAMQVSVDERTFRAHQNKWLCAGIRRNDAEMDFKAAIEEMAVRGFADRAEALVERFRRASRDAEDTFVQVP